MNSFGAQTATPTDYPGIAFSLELLVSTLAIHLGDSWKPARLLAVTDTLIENGRSAAIRDFRRAMMANRLGIKADSSQTSFVALSEGATAFPFFNDVLAAGGLGDVSPVWDGVTPGVDPALPLTADQANPDGREMDFVTAVVIAAFGAASGL